MSVEADAFADDAPRRHPLPAYGRAGAGERGGQPDGQGDGGVGRTRHSLRRIHGRVIRIADDPSAPGDPQEPPSPPDPQDPRDAQVDALLASGTEPPGGNLGIDGAGVQTVLWNQDLLTPSGEFTEFYDVVISDRAPGGAWSTSPVLVTGYLWTGGLAVNASGAAVVAWQEVQDPRHGHVYASYRGTAGAGWGTPERVPHATFVDQVGIDDAGRVLLLYRPKNLSLMAIRRFPDGVWGEPHRVAGPDTASRPGWPSALAVPPW